MSAAARVLLVDDDVELTAAVGEYLRGNGFAPDFAASAEAARRLHAEQHFDVIVLDVMMPGESGLDLLKQLRGESDTPVLMLTARAEELDKVLGLELGADDYLTKPFHTEELLARLRALLRRSAGHAAATLACGGLRLDPRAARASVNGEPLRLTSLEYRLMHYLMMHQGRVISRTELVEHLYDQDFDRDSNTIEVFVGRVRKKIGPDRIETVRGLGYRLIPLEGEAEGA
jgi:two-component system OmpR family response regulator